VLLVEYNDEFQIFNENYFNIMSVLNHGVVLPQELESIFSPAFTSVILNRSIVITDINFNILNNILINNQPPHTLTIHQNEYNYLIGLSDFNNWAENPTNGFFSNNIYYLITAAYVCSCIFYIYTYSQSLMII